MQSQFFMDDKPIRHANLFLGSDTDPAMLIGVQRLAACSWEDDGVINVWAGEVDLPGTSRIEVCILSRPLADGCVEWLIRLNDGGRWLPLNLIDPERRYARTPFAPEHQRCVENTTCLLLGLGSLGSLIAVMLAQAGVRRFVLCDPARFKSENIGRHVGGWGEVDRFKTHIVRDRINDVCPGAVVRCINEDITAWGDDQRWELLRSVGIVIATTDRRVVNLRLNDDLIRLSRQTHPRIVPGIFGGAYDGALGGEALVVLPGEDAPCLGCLRAGLEEPERLGELDYSIATSVLDYEAEPGLGASCHQIASVIAQMTLATVLRGCPGSKLGELITLQRNYVMTGTALSAGYYRFRGAFESAFQPLSGPRKGCPACGVLAVTADEDGVTSGM